MRQSTRDDRNWHRYFRQGSAPFGDGVIISFSASDTTLPQLFINTNYGGFIWYKHFWSEKLRSTIAYGSQSTDWRGPVPNVAQTTTNAAETTRAQTIHANLIWSPVKMVNFGLEFHWGEDYFRTAPGSDLPGGSRGDAKRLTATMQYLF